MPDLRLVKRDRLVKECTECKHRWNEEPRHGEATEAAPGVRIIGRGGWVSLPPANE